MRTTVTLDGDVERLLSDQSHRMHQSFKRTLNDAVRTALAPLSGSAEAPFTVQPTAMGLRAGIDPADLIHQGDLYEVDEFIKTTRRLMVAEGPDDRT